MSDLSELASGLCTPDTQTGEIQTGEIHTGGILSDSAKSKELPIIDISAVNVARVLESSTSDHTQISHEGGVVCESSESDVKDNNDPENQDMPPRERSIVMSWGKRLSLGKIFPETDKRQHEENADKGNKMRTNIKQLEEEKEENIDRNSPVLTPKNICEVDVGSCDIETGDIGTDDIESGDIGTEVGVLCDEGITGTARENDFIMGRECWNSDSQLQGWRYFHNISRIIRID